MLTRFVAALAVLVPIGAIAVVVSAPACDTDGACSGVCPTGTRVAADAGCICQPFDAAYCRVQADCPDAFCPASTVPDACGAGGLWSTAICGCYALPEGGLVPTSAAR